MFSESFLRKLETLTLVGTALTPEYIFATRGGGMPDDEWFAVLWLDAKALEAAFNMEGAFNSALLRVSRDALLDAVIAAVDRILPTPSHVREMTAQGNL